MKVEKYMSIQEYIFQYDDTQFLLKIYVVFFLTLLCVFFLMLTSITQASWQREVAPKLPDNAVKDLEKTFPTGLFFATDSNNNHGTRRGPWAYISHRELWVSPKYNPKPPTKFHCKLAQGNVVTPLIATKLTTTKKQFFLFFKKYSLFLKCIPLNILVYLQKKKYVPSMRYVTNGTFSKNIFISSIVLIEFGVIYRGQKFCKSSLTLFIMYYIIIGNQHAFE